MLYMSRCFLAGSAIIKEKRPKTAWDVQLTKARYEIFGEIPV